MNGIATALNILQTAANDVASYLSVVFRAS